jgi:hypothetical protein
MDNIKAEDTFWGVMYYLFMLHFKKRHVKFSLSEIIAEMLVWISAEVLNFVF